MDDRQWYYANGAGKRQGPVSSSDLQRLKTEGTVGAQTLLWSEGMRRWQTVTELERAADPAVQGQHAQTAESGHEEAVALIDNPYRVPASALSAEPSRVAAVTAQDGDPDLALYEVLVGPRFAVYRRRWRLELGTGHANATWHWPGFLFGPFWMLYRRMYRTAAIWLGVLFAVSMLEVLLELSELPSQLLTLVLSFIVGACGNSWYLAHCRRQIGSARAASAGSPARLQSELAQRGGTRPSAVVAGLLAFVALGVLGTLLLD